MTKSGTLGRFGLRSEDSRSLRLGADDFSGRLFFGFCLDMAANSLHRIFDPFAKSPWHQLINLPGAWHYSLLNRRDLPIAGPILNPGTL